MVIGIILIIDASPRQIKITKFFFNIETNRKYGYYKNKE